MANETRLRTNSIGGLIENNPLASGGTTLTSAALASLSAVSSTEHAVIVLDPDGTAGAPEIVWVTAHTASATSATIERGKEGTSAREHAQDTPWIHGPVASDYPDVLLVGGSPTVQAGTDPDDMQAVVAYNIFGA